jgi:putative ABC transport system permease protein
MREWLARLGDWFQRDRLDTELTEELRFHREQLEGQARSAGADADEARYAAARRLGSPLRAREESRDRWSWPWLDHLQNDIRYAFRGLRRSPGFTATVVLTLGLGIGANAAMFGVIDRLMLRPFAYLRDPGSVNRVYLVRTDRERTVTTFWTQYTRYVDLKSNTSSFSQYAAVAPLTLAVGIGDAVRERPVVAVSAGFFDFFDMRPAAGRFFVAAEDSTPVGASVAVLSYGFWQSEFGGRDVLGQTLKVRNIASVIIGVAPAGFVGVSEGEPPAVFIPITTYGGNDPGNLQGNYYRNYDNGWVHMLVRRKPDIGAAQASRDLSNAHVMSWNAERAMDPSGVDLRMTPAEVAAPRAIAGPVKTAGGPTAGLESKTLLWVGGMAVIVLLIACANVANLMFARVLRRRRETAVRLALGVSRRRLIAQCLTESLLLAGLGCLAGLMLAQWGGAALRRLFVRDLEVLTDWRTMGVAALVAVVAGLLAGLAPAFLATKADLASSLKAGPREGTRQRSSARGALLVLQGALSVLLLIGAGLFVRSLDNVRDLRMGYDAEAVLLASRNLRGMQLSDSERALLSRRLLETAQAIPGVAHAAVASSVPFWSTSNRVLFVPGIDSVPRLGRFRIQTGSPDYFATMGTRILRGRPFTAEDRQGSPRVAVVSQAMADVLWPGREALGQCIRVGADTMPCTTVIGIAENAMQESLLGDEKPYHYYLPLEQHDESRGNHLLLRMRGDPAQQFESVRKALQVVMPGESYVTVRSLEALVDNQRRSWKIGATMFVAFGLLALLVAAVGLYGVITYNVAQRMHELGVRIALGAQSRDVVRLVVGQGLRFAVAGVAIGLAAALAVARWIQPLLFQQSARDPVTYGIVAMLLLAVALTASMVPAIRATRADPNSALRSD